MSKQRILVGEIGRPHGVRGLVRVQSFTAEPADIASYGPLSDESGGKQFVLHWLGGGLARIDGIADRDAAARLTGTRLYLPREKLPRPEEDEFYLTDLIGLAVRDAEGRALGTVRAVDDFGAGAFLTVTDERGGELLLPFTRAVVPEVRIADGYLVAHPPEAVVARPEEGGAPETAVPEPVRPLPRRQDAPKRIGPRGVRGGAA